MTATAVKTKIELRHERQAEALYLIDKLLGPSWGFSWNTRKGAAGVCNYRTKTISLSAAVWDLNDSQDAFRNTLTHEIAHALVGGEAGHGPVWRRQHRALGGDGARCAAVEVAPEAKWLGTCPSGKHTVRRHRLTASTRRASCSACSPRFDASLLFVWRLNG